MNKKPIFVGVLIVVVVIGGLWFWEVQTKGVISLQSPNQIAGVDSNNNGIRDDIDTWITAKYGANPKQVAAAQISARALQKTLLVDATDKDAALAAMENSADAGVCAGRLFRSTNDNGASQMLDEIYLRTVNTPERIAQKKAVATAAGQFTKSTANVVCE